MAMIVVTFLHKCPLSYSSRTDPFRKRSTSLSVGLPRRVCAFVCGLSVLDTIFMITFNDAIFVQCWPKLRACAIKDESALAHPCHVCALVNFAHALYKLECDLILSQIIEISNYANCYVFCVPCIHSSPTFS